MSNIYLSNINDKFVINDLTKIIKASGVDLSDVETLNEKNWFSITKVGDSTYHVYTQKDLICFDVTISYDSSKVSPTELTARMFIPVSADLEYCYEIKLVDYDTLVYTMILQSATSSAEYDRLVYDIKKANNLQSSSLIEMILMRFKDIIEESKQGSNEIEADSCKKMQLYKMNENMRRMCYARTYFKDSFAIACGVNADTEIAENIEEGINGITTYSGVMDGLSYYLRYKCENNSLVGLAITIVKKLSDGTEMQFDINADVDYQINFQVIKHGTGEEVDGYSNRLAPISWEQILDIVQDIVADPENTAEIYKPQFNVLSMPVERRLSALTK